MTLSKDKLEASLKVLKALDEAIKNGPWEYNLFFRGIGKKLRDARENLVKKLGLEEYAKEEERIASEASLTEGQYTLVYVSLYQAEGANLQKWQSVVNTLAGYNVTRPVYQNEEDIKNAIRAKEFRQNDAYAIVKIRKDDIMPVFADKPPSDRHGHPLLVLREGAIKLENIQQFVHQSGQYTFRNGVLTKVA